MESIILTSTGRHMYPSSKLHCGGDFLQQTRLASLQVASGLEGGPCIKAGFSIFAEHCYKKIRI